MHTGRTGQITGRRYAGRTEWSIPWGWTDINRSLTYELPPVGGVTDFRRLCQLHANKVYRNIKNRTVCFQERFRLLSLAAVLRKHPSWFQNPIDIVFWNRNVCFLRTGRSQNPENNSVLFFICPRLCGMQYPGCENPSIQVTNGSNQSLNSGRCALLWLANHKTSRMTAFCRYLFCRHSSHNRSSIT